MKNILPVSLLCLLFTSLLVTSTVSVDALVGMKGGLLKENQSAWGIVGNARVCSVIVADVDQDGANEIVTGGYYSDGSREFGQVVVKNGVTMAVENSVLLSSGLNARINSITVGNVDGDYGVEIVTGGFYSDGTRDLANVVVLNGITLQTETNMSWFWNSDCHINSVAVGDVDGDAAVEIVTGGFTNDFSRDNSQLVVLTGSNPQNIEGCMSWYWVSDTGIYSVAIADVNQDGCMDVVTGGAYDDGSRLVSQLAVWNGSNVQQLEAVKCWYWTSDTYISSVAVADVDSDNYKEIVTGGAYYDGTRFCAQMAVFSGGNLDNLEDVCGWYSTSNTFISSIAVGNFDSDGELEIVAGGMCFDGVRFLNQVTIWHGPTLSPCKDAETWYNIGETETNSVAIGNIDFDGTAEFVCGGYYDEGSHDVAELTVWSRPPVAFALWGTQQYADAAGGESEKTLSGQVTDDIMGFFQNTGRYSYLLDGWGLATQPSNVYSAVYSCDRNYDFTVFYYKGHSYPGQCDVQGCTFSHYGIYDNEGPPLPPTPPSWDNVIQDYLVHDELSSFKHGFVMLWTCGSAWSNATGGFNGGHSWGWEASFMGTTGLNTNAYTETTDNSGRCFIGFDNFSILYRNITGYQNYNYGDFTRQFFNYLLQGYTVRQALNFATTTTHNPNTVQSYGNSQLYLGYPMTDTRSPPYPTVTCYMRVWGDGDLRIPS